MSVLASAFSVLFYLQTSVFCFNIEVRNPVEKRGEIDTYFGYSVALHKTVTDGDISQSWLLIGAPRADNKQPGTNHSGALFKCPVPPIGETHYPYCEQVNTDGRRIDDDYDDEMDETHTVALYPPGKDEYKDDQWMGVNVKSQGPGGKVVVCAHRYITTMVDNSDVSQHRFSPGLCYLLKSNLEGHEKLTPCEGRSVKMEHQEFGYCQVGTSLAVLPDGMALLGSPGPFTWRGTMFVRDTKGLLDRDHVVYMGPLSETHEPIEKYSYVGMSVAGGKFFDDGVTYYASGAPRANLHGAVYVFHRIPKVEVMNVSLIINGELFGSSFGYEILAVDINKDGYDDLIVGAPFFFNNTEGGAVYIYYNIRKCTYHVCEPDMRLTGPAESRFGLSMTSLGDINRDGYTDIAIGAPYEGGGAIYIYLGSANGIVSPHSQKIHPEVENLRTIGYSLSGGLDMDDNGYPDLLTGAYESDRAYLFRTRQIVDIKVDVVGEELKNINISKRGCDADRTKNNTCFSFQTCFTIISEDTNVDRVRCKVEETYEKIKYSRIWFMDLRFPDNRHTNRTVYTSVIKGQKRYCQSHTVYIRDGIRDILSPLTFKVNYTLSNNSANMPILNRTSVENFQATFQKDCGNDDLCQSYLVLSGEVVPELDLGEHESFYLNVSVSNNGESAYEANLYVSHPLALSYVNLDENPSNLICATENDMLVVCNLGNPFRGSTSSFLRLKFEINQKQAKDNKLQIVVFVNSTSEELSQRTKETLISTIKKRAEVKITGGATFHIVYGGEIKGESAMHYFEDIGQRIWHKYQVENQGPWHVENTEVLIKWPYQVASYTAQGKWLLYLEGVPEFENPGDGFCTVYPPEAVNPLFLNSTSGSNESPPENFEILNDTESTFHVRRRRDAEYVVKPVTKKGPDGKERQVVTMDCERQSAKCIEIKCVIRKLPKGAEATVNIKSRVWNSTLVEDYSNVDYVEILSIARINITDPAISQENKYDDIASAKTLAQPILTQADSGVTIWIIIAAVLIGLLLLVILVVVLWKLGFFKRNRISDPTLSGNLTKQGESETLLNK